jgi:imidazoleglycerol-phosphate dehydratase
MKGRQARIARKTKETDIRLRLNVDGKGRGSIRTGIAFFDHMLTLFARHAVVDLELKCKGDLEVDAHHTVEDCGLALGQAFTSALDDKKGIRRYGFAFERFHAGTTPVATDQGGGEPPTGGKIPPSTAGGTPAATGPLSAEAYVPMDECLARCVIDFGGRPFFVWRGLDGLAFKPISGEPSSVAGRKRGPTSLKSLRRVDMAMEFRFGLAKEFFQAFANEARCNLHLELLYGEEPHHVSEALFKAFAKAVDAACARDPRIAGRLPTTKGKL